MKIPALFDGKAGWLAGLASHLRKWMKKIIVHSQSRVQRTERAFQQLLEWDLKRKSRMDALVRLINEGEKTKKRLLMWREVSKIGNGGRMYNFIMDFLTDRIYLESNWSRII